MKGNYLARTLTRMKAYTRLLGLGKRVTTAQRYRSETENFILEDLFSSVLSQFKKYHPSGNLKFNYLGIFQSLKLRILMEKKSFQFLLS